MADLPGREGELRFTVEVTRKATGKVERFDLVGKVTSDGCDPLRRGEERRN